MLGRTTAARQRAPRGHRCVAAGRFDGNGESLEDPASFWRLNAFTEDELRPACTGSTTSGAEAPDDGGAGAGRLLAVSARSIADVITAGSRTDACRSSRFDALLVGDRPDLDHVTLGAVVFVLLIACANISNLHAGAWRVRRHEMALRAALGRSRGRIAAQSADGKPRPRIAGQRGGRALAAGLLDAPCRCCRRCSSPPTSRSISAC